MDQTKNQIRCSLSSNSDNSGSSSSFVVVIVVTPLASTSPPLTDSAIEIVVSTQQLVMRLIELRKLIRGSNLIHSLFLCWRWRRRREETNWRSNSWQINLTGKTFASIFLEKIIHFVLDQLAHLVNPFIVLSWISLTIHPSIWFCWLVSTL